MTELNDMKKDVGFTPVRPLAPPKAEFLRAKDLPRVYPVLGRSTWAGLLLRGEIPSRLIGRARIVSVADVERFLEGKAALR